MKLAILDQSFHWPPTGGSWVDVRENSIRLKSLGIEPRIFVPVWRRWSIPGGNISEDPGIPCTRIPVTGKQFNFHQLPRLFEAAIRDWHPDAIMISNTFYLAPYLINKFPNLPVFLRVFAHELVCPNYMNVSKVDIFKWVDKNPTGKICGKSLLDNPIECWMCGLRRLGGTLIGPRLNPMAVEYWSGLSFSPFYSSMVRTSLNKLAGILVYNPYIKGLFSSINTPIHIVPGGVDIKQFSPEPVGHNNRPITVLMSGRTDDARKGFKVFEAAVEMLWNEGLEFNACITGKPGKNVHQNIKQTKWYDHSEIASLYNDVDIFVAPSTWPEPFGLVVMEAMASGLPVIASKIGGMQYTVAHNETGFQFSPGDATELKQYLSRLIKDANLRKKMGAAGRLRVEKLFDWDKVAANFTAPILKQECTGELDWTAAIERND